MLAVLTQAVSSFFAKIRESIALLLSATTCVQPYSQKSLIEDCKKKLGKQDPKHLSYQNFCNLLDFEVEHFFERAIFEQNFASTSHKKTASSP